MLDTKKRVSVLIVLLLQFILGSVVIFAQQTEHYGIWKESIITINPAYAGLSGNTNYIVNFRSQWVNLDGSPMTGSFYMSSNVPAAKSGLGVKIQNETIGNRSFLNLAVHYNYRIVNKNKKKWSVGFSGSRESFNLDFSNVLPSDGLPGQNDNRLLIWQDPVSYYTIGVGMAIVLKDLNIGLTSRQLVQIEEANSIFYHTNQELFFNISYNFTLNKSIEIAPYSVFYSNFKHSQAFVGIEMEVYNQFYSSVGLRGDGSSIESLAISFGLKLNKMLTVKYQYEFGMNDLSSEFAGSHEIIITGELNKSIGKMISHPPIFSPRAL